MTLQIIIKPISKWIGAETRTPGNSQFRQTYSNTKKILEFELEKLRAVPSSVRLEMFIKPEDLRRDGELLRAHAKPYKPGIVLSFSITTRRKNPGTSETIIEAKTLSYPCDTYNDWQDNIRAIALSLQELRNVARRGVFKYEDMIERLALPSAEGKLSDRDAALEFISKHSGRPRKQLEELPWLKSGYLEAAMKLHPDKGGSAEDFHRLQDAKRILGL